MTGTLPMAAACGVAAVIKLHKHMARINSLSPPNLSEKQGDYSINMRVVIDDKWVSSDNHDVLEGSPANRPPSTCVSA